MNEIHHYHRVSDSSGVLWDYPTKLMERETPIKLQGPDPNAKDRLCRENGHPWKWDKELRCYTCRYCGEVDR